MEDTGKRRIPLGAALIAMLAMTLGVAQAVEFDEKLKSPMVASGATFRAQAETFKSGLLALQGAGPETLLKDASLAKQQFDLLWQLQLAVDAGKYREDLAAMGYEHRDDGTYGIDYSAHPEWQRYDDQFTTILPGVDPALLSTELKARGLRDSDFAAIQEYVRTHDVTRESARRSLPIAIGFSKLVKKYDKLKMPVPDTLAMSYLYQRARADAVARQQWVQGLLKTLDPQAGRILVSYFSELKSTGLISPDDQRAGIDELKRRMRDPDFEKLATREATGDAP